MKKNIGYSAFLIFALVIHFSCKKALDKLLTFNYAESTKITIPPVPIVSNVPVVIPTPEISSNADTELKKNGLSLDNVKTLKISTFNLNIESPEEANFNFLNAVKIYISSAGLSDELIASKENIPSGLGKFLTLETTGANIVNHLKNNKYSIKIETKTDEITTKEIVLRADMTFSVTAQVFNN